MSAPEGVDNNAVSAPSLVENEPQQQNPSNNAQNNQPPVLADAAAGGGGMNNNNAPVAVAADPAANGGVNNAPQQPPPQQQLRASLSNDLQQYFTTLSSALHRQQSTGTNSATSGGSTSVLTLLQQGVAPITAASNESSSIVQQPSLTPQQGALYLYAVAQNIVGLEAAVLGSNSGNSSSGSAGAGGSGMNGHVLGGGGITAKQVAEIIMAVSTAATFCNSRTIITQSGILPALSHLIESTGTITAPPLTLMNQSKSGLLHSLTPFHSEFLQVALLAGQYRYASAFLASRPMSHTTLNSPYFRIDSSSYLRTHYYAGLVHIGVGDWNSALDSFHLCLTIPCGSVSAVSVAARKKSLLVQCLLLESEELDGNPNPTQKANVQSKTGNDGKSPKSALENKVLNLPGAASAAVCKYMTASFNRVVGGERRGSTSVGDSAPSEYAGAETSEQQPPQQQGRGERSSRRRMRSANSNSSSDVAGGGERGGEGSKANKFSNLGSYHELVSTYISGNAANYTKLLTEMMELLYTDGNWGLAKQLEGRLLAYRNIRKVASVYSVVGVDVLEKKMQEMGSSGEVGKHGIEDLLMGMAATDAKDPLLVDPFVARIDHSTGMVSFLDQNEDESDGECDDEALMETDLSNRLQSCIALAERVRDLDITLSTSTKYQRMKNKGSRGASEMLHGAGAGASVADIGMSDDGPLDIDMGNW